jgi:hypothetical protein
MFVVSHTALKSKSILADVIWKGLEMRVDVRAYFQSAFQKLFPVTYDKLTTVPNNSNWRNEFRNQRYENFIFNLVA